MSARRANASVHPPLRFRAQSVSSAVCPRLRNNASVSGATSDASLRSASTRSAVCRVQRLVASRACTNWAEVALPSSGVRTGRAPRAFSR